MLFLVSIAALVIWAIVCAVVYFFVGASLKSAIFSFVVAIVVVIILNEWGAAESGGDELDELN